MHKFNILTDVLPDFVTIFDIQYPVHTSFRNWLNILALLEQESQDAKQTAEALKLCYKDTLPPNIVSAFLGMLTFLNRGTDFSVSPNRKEAQLFSFSQDADIIYATFYRQYGIDLTKEDMHWYTFCTLLSSLSEENPFATVLKIRSMDETQIKDRTRRRKIAELKDKFSLEGGTKQEIDVAETLAGLF